MDEEFKGKIMSNYSKDVEWQQGITTGIGFCVYTILGCVQWLYHNGIVVNTPEF